MNGSVLQRLLAVATCKTEEDEYRLEQLINPSTRSVMGPVYEETLGYNPLTYFDRQEAEGYFKEMIEDAPQSVKVILEEKQEEILESVIEHKENLNREYLITLLNLSFEKITGWKNKKYHNINLQEDFVDVEEVEDDEFEEEEYEDDYEEDPLDEELDLTEDDE